MLGQDDLFKVRLDELGYVMLFYRLSKRIYQKIITIFKNGISVPENTLFWCYWLTLVTVIKICL